MKSLVTLTILSHLLLGCRVGSFQFMDGNAPDKLWSQHAWLDIDRPTINATTFGEGNSIISGAMMPTIKGQPIYSFQGIRYANADRFQIPVPVDQYWDDELIANHIGPMCPQPGLVSGLPTGSEDCLFLNVYMPQMPDGKKKLPVMLFIHGGAFFVGDTSYYLPTKLLDREIILVTIHYRLGTLGFFFLDSDDAPGNYALYDQLASIEWVHKHIEDFGGNKDLVTVFGQSAGGVSASYVQLYPQAEGKVHGIISQSGSTIDVWSLDQDPFYATNYIASYLGCVQGEDIDLDCIKDKPADDLVYATGSLVASDRANGYMGFRGVSPTIQGPKVSNRILYQHPTEYFHKKEFLDIPRMMGTTKQEGSFVLGVMYFEFLVPNDLVDNSTYMRERMVADIIEAIGVYDVSNALSVSCTLEYCPDIDLADFNDTSSYCMIDMTGALFLKAGAWQTANLLSYYGEQENIYFYSFDFMSEDTMFDWIVGQTPFEPGVGHMDDLMYLFAMPVVLEDSQLEVMDRMTFLWTNFATYLDPTPDVLEAEMAELSIPKWFSYKFEDTYFMLMREEFVMQSDFLLRWTITVDEIQTGGEVTAEPVYLTTRALEVDLASSTSHNSISTHTSEESVSTTDASTTTSERNFPVVTENYDDEYDALEEEADAYMAAMIAFIVGFCISTSLAVVFYIRSR